jgi:O-antigen ligase
MWKVVPPFGSDQFEARHAENELLQQFYAYGVVGIAMLIGLYGSLYRRIRRLNRSTVKIIFVGILLFVLVRGLAEAEPFDLLLPLWLIVLISLLAECELVECEDTAREPVYVSVSVPSDAPQAAAPALH